MCFTESMGIITVSLGSVNMANCVHQPTKLSKVTPFQSSSVDKIKSALLTKLNKNDFLEHRKAQLTPQICKYGLRTHKPFQSKPHYWKTVLLGHSHQIKPETTRS